MWVKFSWLRHRHAWLRPRYAGLTFKPSTKDDLTFPIDNPLREEVLAHFLNTEEVKIIELRARNTLTLEINEETLERFRALEKILWLPQHRKVIRETLRGYVQGKLSFEGMLNRLSPYVITYNL